MAVAETDIFDRFFSAEAVREGKVTLRRPEAGYDRWFRFCKPENILTFIVLSEVESHIHTREWETIVADLENALPHSRLKDYDILPVLRWNLPVLDSAMSFLESEHGLSFELMLGKSDMFTEFFETESLQSETGFLNRKPVLTRLLFNSMSYVQTMPNNEFGGIPRKMPTDLGYEVEVTNMTEHGGWFDLEDTNNMLEAMIAEKKEKQ